MLWELGRLEKWLIFPLGSLIHICQDLFPKLKPNVVIIIRRCHFPEFKLPCCWHGEKSHTRYRIKEICKRFILFGNVCLKERQRERRERGEREDRVRKAREILKIKVWKCVYKWEYGVRVLTEIRRASGEGRNRENLFPNSNSEQHIPRKQMWKTLNFFGY